MPEMYCMCAWLKHIMVMCILHYSIYNLSILASNYMKYSYNYMYVCISDMKEETREYVLSLHHWLINSANCLLYFPINFWENIIIGNLLYI